MTAELDSGIRSFQKLDGENEDLTLILGKKMEIFPKCFQCWCNSKGKFICMLKRKFCIAVFDF
jgi:hypothetical protein